jgi:hypothetical protein
LALETTYPHLLTIIHHRPISFQVKICWKYLEWGWTDWVTDGAWWSLPVGWNCTPPPLCHFLWRWASIMCRKCWTTYYAIEFLDRRKKCWSL